MSRNEWLIMGEVYKVYALGSKIGMNLTLKGKQRLSIHGLQLKKAEKKNRRSEKKKKVA